jgi:hypothetical protein
MEIDMTLSQAAKGYLLNAYSRQAAQSPYLANYETALRRLRGYVSDLPLSEITANNARKLQARLRSRAITPDGIPSPPARKLSDQHTRSFKRPGQVECVNSLPTEARGRRILLFLPNTGSAHWNLCQEEAA